MAVEKDVRKVGNLLERNSKVIGILTTSPPKKTKRKKGQKAKSPVVSVDDQDVKRTIIARRCLVPKFFFLFLFYADQTTSHYWPSSRCF